MAKKIVWSKRASIKFDSILTYLESNWGEKVTANFVKNVFDFLELLQEFPELGMIENKANNIRGFTIVEQINLFYKINGDQVILLNFYDYRQNPKNKRF